MYKRQVSLTNDRHPANVIYNKIRLRYPVPVHAVNPRGGRFLRDPLYASIAEIPETPDLVVIAVRAEAVPAVLAQCIERGAGAAVIVSGGFAESGRPDLQERIAAMAREAHFPFIGPNCLGVYAPGRFDTFFLPGERLVRPDPGGVGFVSQSGGVLVDQMVKFSAQGLGFSLAVSIGNKAVVREIDLLRHFAADPETRVIAFYLEGFGRNEGRAFLEAAQAAGKPVVVLKAGKTDAGRRAVGSHTASLAGDYRVFSDALAQFGIVEAHDEFELTCFCESLSHYPRAIEGRVGVVTVSGGHGALATDILSGLGLEVPALSAALQDLVVGEPSFFESAAPVPVARDRPDRKPQSPPAFAPRRVRGMVTAFPDQPLVGAARLHPELAVFAGCRRAHGFSRNAFPEGMEYAADARRGRSVFGLPREKLYPGASSPAKAATSSRQKAGMSATTRPQTRLPSRKAG